jgi:hypothetical protein
MTKINDNRLRKMLKHLMEKKSLEISNIFSYIKERSNYEINKNKYLNKIVKIET